MDGMNIRITWVNFHHHLLGNSRYFNCQQKNRNLNPPSVIVLTRMNYIWPRNKYKPLWLRFECSFLNNVMSFNQLRFIQTMADGL